MRVLIIEDDDETREWIARGLEQEGYQTETAVDGQEGLLLATQSHFDGMVVDRMLPKLDGITLIKSIRAADVHAPIVMLTALSDTPQRIEGLNAGADDYLGKPFAFAELVARLRALGRRPPLNPVRTVFKAGILRIDLTRHEFTRSGESLELTPTEFRLMEILMQHAGKVVTRTMLLEQVWHFHFDPRTSVVETNMSRLRNKVNRKGQGELIETVRGYGYRVRAPRTDD